MRRIISGLALAAALAVTGCAARGLKPDAESALRERVEQYHDFISLRDYDAAALLVADQYRQDFLVVTKPMQRGYTLESYAVVKVEMNSSGDQAAVAVSRSFIPSASVTLQSQEYVQRWVLGADGAWYLAGPPY